MWHQLSCFSTSARRAPNPALTTPTSEAMPPRKTDTTRRKEPDEASPKPRDPNHQPNGESAPPPDPAAPRPAHRRISKISRLPYDVRQLINIMLRDGAPYALVAQRLAERGHKINVNNLSRRRNYNKPKFITSNILDQTI